MIVLEQYPVRKVIAVVHPAAHLYGIFFKYAHVGGSFARVEKFCFAAFQKFYHAAGIGGYAAHALEVIERRALAGEEHAYIARYFSYMFAPFHLFAVLFEQLRLRIRIEQRKRARKYVEPAYDAVLFTDQIYRTLFIAGHDGVGADVFVGDIFGKRQLYQLVGVEFFCYGIIHFLPPSRR